MKNKLTLLLLLSLLTSLAFGQKKYFEEKFKHFSFVEKSDTIRFHTYSSETHTPKKILIYLQGSGDQPIYQLIKHIDTIPNKNERPKIKKYLEVNTTVPINLETLPDDYLFITISKKGLPFEYIGDQPFKAPKSFYLHDNLDYRVWQTDRTIKYVLKHILKNPEKLIVFGHSEGTEVVAKLGTMNKDISHIGYLSGGGNAQYYDFILDIRKYVQRGEMTEEESVAEIEKLFAEVKDIYSNPNSLDKMFMGHPYRKWSKSVESSVDNLLQITVPLYVAHGAKDKAVPIESAYLIPIEFIRKNKNNLTFKVYPKLNHSFGISPTAEDSEYIDKWDLVFTDFLKWCEQN